MLAGTFLCICPDPRLAALATCEPTRIGLVQILTFSKFGHAHVVALVENRLPRLDLASNLPTNEVFDEGNLRIGRRSAAEIPKGIWLDGAVVRPVRSVRRRSSVCPRPRAAALTASPPIYARGKCQADETRDDNHEMASPASSDGRKRRGTGTRWMGGSTGPRVDPADAKSDLKSSLRFRAKGCVIGVQASSGRP